MVDKWCCDEVVAPQSGFLWLGRVSFTSRMLGHRAGRWYSRDSKAGISMPNCSRLSSLKLDYPDRNQLSRIQTWTRCLSLQYSLFVYRVFAPCSHWYSRRNWRFPLVNPVSKVQVNLDFILITENRQIRAISHVLEDINRHCLDTSMHMALLPMRAQPSSSAFLIKRCFASHEASSRFP